MVSNKGNVLSTTFAQNDRQFGKGSVMRLEDKECVVIPSISMGSLGLDVVLSIGGLPKGRIGEM